MEMAAHFIFLYNRGRKTKKEKGVKNGTFRGEKCKKSIYNPLWSG